MQIGYNNDVQYRGKTFHIQTEDHGVKLGSIESQIFHSGAIYDTSIVSYKKMMEKITDPDEQIKKIRTMMQANHKSLYKKLLAGEYDTFAGLEPLKEGEEVDSEAELVPGQDRVPEAALQFEKGERPFPETEQGEFVSLDDIQKKLMEDEKASADSPSTKTDPLGTVSTSKSSASDSAATMMLDPNKLPKADDRKRKNSSVPSATKSALRAKIKSQKADHASKSTVPEFTATGVKAYRGLPELREELGITELVEIFLAS